MLRHSLLSHLDEGLLVWRSWAWKELNGTVLWAEYVADQHSIDVVLGDDGAIELGNVIAVSNSRLIQLSLATNGLGDLTH